MVDENVYHNGQFRDVEYKVSGGQVKLFLPYIETLCSLRAEAKDQKRKFAKRTIAAAKAAGLYSKTASVSAMALALDWENNKLPRVEVSTAKKAAKYVAWQHISNIVGDDYIRDHNYSCKTTMEALSLYTLEDSYEDNIILNPIAEAFAA
jgi:hypothetical protein